VVLCNVVFLSAVVAWQAGEAGEAAEPIVEARLRTDDARRILHDHEERGEKVAPLMAATAGLIAFSLIPRRGVRLAAGLAATAAALGTAAVVVMVAHDGGRLVHWFDSGPGTHAGTTSGSDPD
jgi:(2Fe-2S) ferredoxin